MALLTDDNAVLAQKAGAYYSIINAMLYWAEIFAGQRGEAG